MNIIGIDLSGPANHKDTVIAILKEDHQKLKINHLEAEVSDEKIFSLIERQLSNNEILHIGIDAPLSYQDGGGDRPADRSLRTFAKSLGMKSGSIMPPTLTRMVYLTMRGIHLAHMLRNHFGDYIQLFEVHPGIALASRLPRDRRSMALHYKKDKEYRFKVMEWLFQHYLSHSPFHAPSTHHVDALLAGIATWHAASPDRSPTWQVEAHSPHHPFPFIC
ncbi:DUF429 domain-containing protein [Halobacillus sp. BBL2006]|uniref:DUF429 domain-containing protein n=1 Tax=Halobacillus sp. BBL2006 TaxID=1543706 RepID=UPI0005423807|nr:DUF429 domain-containing protein [Halobacillus sp. BBL2006]KHE69715.1 hypothetical protein LD39_12490 [Halobacillus sp. BBL2006]